MENKSSKILVTGGAGFLGHHLIKRLAAKNFQIRVLAQAKENTDLIEGYKPEVIRGDISNIKDARRAVMGCDYVINLAGIVSYWNKDNDLMYRVNTLGARNIAQACLESGIKKLVHVSSTVTIGTENDGELADENTVYNLFKLKVPYCDTKFLGEVEILKVAAKGLNVSFACPGSMYGAGDIRRIKTDSLFKFSFPFNLVDVQNGIAVVDVEDVADGLISILEKGKPSERYILVSENLSFGKIKSIIAKEMKVFYFPIPLPKLFLEWITHLNILITSITKQRPKFTPEMMRFHEVQFHFKNEKAKKDLGIKFTPFKESVRKAVEWYKQNGYL